MALRRPWLFALALGAAIVFGPGCAAPVLPLPPPSALVEGPPDMNGLVTISGNARPGSFVAGLNETTEAGVIVRADLTSGDYTLQLAAAVGDEIVLWQYDGSEAGSMQRRVIIQP